MFWKQINCYVSTYAPGSKQNKKKLGMKNQQTMANIGRSDMIDNMNAYTETEYIS